MPIKLPVEVAFYYEATDIRDRLLLCIPIAILVRMVENGEADKSILEDNPDGIDIKVSGSHFEELYRKYSLILPDNPEGLVNAFKFLRQHTRNRKFPKTGFIHKNYLIELWNYLQENLEYRFWGSIDEDGFTLIDNTKSQKGILKRKYRRDNELNQNFKKLTLPDYDPKKSIKEQSFSIIKMSDGEEPFSYISKIKQKK